jgi:hypothetical protein
VNNTWQATHWKVSSRKIQQFDNFLFALDLGGIAEPPTCRLNDLFLFAKEFFLTLESITRRRVVPFSNVVDCALRPNMFDVPCDDPIETNEERERVARAALAGAFCDRHG